MGLIYMRISPSGGKYIGQTKLSEKQRWEDHCREALYVDGQNYNSLLNRAIRKYGANTFQVIILEDNLETEFLDAKEIYWIDYYKTFYLDNNHGYNMTRGGSGNKKLEINDNELIALWESQISIIEVANYFSCERQAIRDRLLKLGYTGSDLRKRANKISVDHRINNHYDKNLILELWNDGLSTVEIGKRLGHDRHTISRILTKYINIDKQELQKRQTSYGINANKKVIIQLDYNDNIINTWDSISEAARQLNLHASNIVKVLKGERKTCGGFKWKYKGE